MCFFFHYFHYFYRRFDIIMNSAVAAFQVDPANVRPIQGVVDALVEAERVAEATKEAIKRKIAQAASADFQSRNLPAKLRIEPDDPEDVVSSSNMQCLIITTILISSNHSRPALGIY